MQGKRAYPLQLQPFLPLELGEHWRQEHVSCDFCDIWLYDQQAYVDHADDFHPMCPVCDEGWIYRDWNEEFRTHLRSALFKGVPVKFAHDVLSNSAQLKLMFYYLSDHTVQFMSADIFCVVLLYILLLVSHWILKLV